jgi:hypothetical protein
MMASQQARVDRIERSLKRLGFRLSKVGRSFHITDGIGELAIIASQQCRWLRSRAGSANLSDQGESHGDGAGVSKRSPRLKAPYMRAMEILEEDGHICAVCLFDAIADLLGVDELIEVPCEEIGRA